MFDPKELERISTQLKEVKQNIEDGPWMREPDRVEFKFAGFDCLLQRSPMSYAWCGYVGLPKGHPYYGKSYNEDGIDVRVHGGLTYSEECRGAICHETDGEDILHWLGFDCCHYNDLAPGLYCRKDVPFEFMRKILSGQYKDLDYAMAQTKSLAEQLKAVA